MYIFGNTSTLSVHGVLSVITPTESLYKWELLETSHGNRQPVKRGVKINDPQPNVERPILNSSQMTLSFLLR